MSKKTNKRLVQHKTRKALNSCLDIMNMTGHKINHIRYGTGLDLYEIRSKSSMHVSPSSEGQS